jgi:hypothetical protein
MSLILSNLLRTTITVVTPVSLGGTGVTSIAGLVKGNGTAAFTAAQIGVDFIAPNGALGNPISGDLLSCTNAIAYGLKTSSSTISISTATAPTTGQMLTATSATTAIWQTPTGGTVTNVSALSIGSNGTDVSSSVTNGSSTPVITLNIPTASSTVRGVLSTADWVTFNSKLGSVPIASSTVLGGVKVGSGLDINGSGVLSTTYTLPVSTSVILGGVKQGSNVTIAGDGTISVAAPYTLTAATTSALGGVIIPVVATSGITNTSGTIGLAVATNTQLGGVKIDNSTITINNGVISLSSSITTGLTIGTTLTIPTGDTASRPTATQGNLRFNTSLGKFEGYYGSAWGAVGGGLSPTAIQTSNGYIAKANDLVRCNTTAGAFSITLPSNPVDGDIVGVIDTHKMFAVNNLTILVAGSKQIEDDTASLILDIAGSYIALVYNDVNSNWRILETPLGTGISSTSIITTNGYVASVNDLVRCDTTTAAFSVTLPSNPIDGSIVNFVDVASAGSFLTNNLTVLPGIGKTVENDTSLLLDVNGTYVSLVYNLSTSNWKVLQAPYCLLGNVTTSITLSGLTKGTGNTLTNAVAGTDYQAPIGTISGLVKGNGANALTAATAGVDYMPAVTWVIKNTTYNPAVAGDHILANTSGGTFTITLPASPAASNTIVIADYAGTFATSNLTIASNGNKILGTVQDLVLNVSNRNATLVYTDSTRGWIILF